SEAATGLAPRDPSPREDLADLAAPSRDDVPHKSARAFFTSATAAFGVFAAAEMWPIFRPARASRFPYRCTRTPGSARARSNAGEPRGLASDESQSSPRRL